MSRAILDKLAKELMDFSNSPRNPKYDILVNLNGVGLVVFPKTKYTNCAVHDKP